MVCILYIILYCLQEAVSKVENEASEEMGRVDEGVEEFFTKKIIPDYALWVDLTHTLTHTHAQEMHYSSTIINLNLKLNYLIFSSISYTVK